MAIFFHSGQQLLVRTMILGMSMNFGRCSAARCSAFIIPRRVIHPTTTFAPTASRFVVTTQQFRHFHSSTALHSSQLEQQMAQDAMTIVESAIQAVDPYEAVRKKMVDIDISSYDQVILVAFGKASTKMASAVVESINDIPMKGVVIGKDGHVEEERPFLEEHNLEVFEAAHPVPDERSVVAAKRLMDVVQSSSNNSLVICCISGGGSALFCQPLPSLTLSDLQAVNAALLASGMGIQEMNVIRKRLETGKGGRLAAACHPADVLTLVLSDVLGDPLDLIASGPTVPDTSTWQDAWGIVERYNLELPAAVMELLEKGVKGEVEDSPSADHPVFENAKTVLVGNNALAVQAAAAQAQSLGYHPVILGTEIEGEAKEIAHVYTAMARHLQQQASSSGALPPFSVAPSLPVALIAGGETTVQLTPNSGKGGRNQELALAAGLQLDATGTRNVVLASVGTDGGDGPTDAAGAVVDGTTVRGTRSEALQALANHDAYHYLQSLSEGMEDASRIPPLVKTGPTGTNVADVCVTLIEAMDKEI